MTPPDFRFEMKIWERGKVVAGVDEAGRGPLAGPVVAAAVILPIDAAILGLNDSKKLSPLQREKLFGLIRERAISYAVGIVEPEEIDRINILRAAIRAMELAVVNLSLKPDYLLIDGNARTSLLIPQEAIVKGDARSNSIAAASIIAKVTRDGIMDGYHKIYPQYNFTQHKGYPTGNHLEALRKFGACPIHRKTFRGVL